MSYVKQFALAVTLLVVGTSAHAIALFVDTDNDGIDDSTIEVTIQTNSYLGLETQITASPWFGNAVYALEVATTLDDRNTRAFVAYNGDVDLYRANGNGSGTALLENVVPALPGVDYAFGIFVAAGIVPEIDGGVFAQVLLVLVAAWFMLAAARARSQRDAAAVSA